jgi:hypothetical protein
VGPHSLFVGGGGRSLSVGARCLQARVGSFSSVGGCCVCGRSRSGVGVALGVVLVGGGLLRPRALAFVGGGCSRQWGVVASMGARVRGWASRSGSFSSVGCCYGGVSSSWWLFVFQRRVSSVGGRPLWVGDGRRVWMMVVVLSWLVRVVTWHCHVVASPHPLRLILVLVDHCRVASTFCACVGW